MAIPAELRGDPPPSTLAWVAEQFGVGARVAAVRRLANAQAAAVHAVDVDDAAGARYELVVRRWVRADLPPDPGVVENETAALTLLASVPESQLPVPRFVAADAEARRADAPALVMTRLVGRDVLAPPDREAYLDGLASALHAVHAVSIRAGVLGDYRPWGLDEMGDPPSWTRRPAVWTRAFEIARQPVPRCSPGLCHRDFHPGNVLWDAGTVSGVVDWTHACRGPAAADVAHCSANLALLIGLDAADEFTHRYGPVADLAWFQVAGRASWTSLDTWRWHDAGRTDLDDDTLARRSDDFLAAAVARVDADR